MAGPATLGAGAVVPTEADAAPTSPAVEIGLSKRELEREVAWQLRNPSDDPRQLAKQLGATMVSLIVKNNKKIAEQLGNTSDPDEF